ncbi:fimbrillin family protein [Parasphaerochaeta coccoides]|uniref:Regulator of chromosome condensation RCC1 n=1 Tax=Parasphaerochaeta coccoides (strain ATCC BAA-1237 / DSM 17374 / SPN1) TaxID=760011 RepID=F4GM77_PARC1|nr:regulator of chromosome condensation RCC1 [Parasphaerochaeta coccoides DSM 17374]
MVFLTILMLLITFISCDNKLNISNTNAVRFSTEIGRKATANSEWQADDEVGIFMATANVDLDDTPTPVDARFNKKYLADTAFQTSGFTPATAADTLKWDDISNSTATHFDFIAYYPYDENISDPTTVAIDINRSSSEQMTGTADFLWGRADNVQNNTSTVRLKLDHMLSRLIVNISPSTSVDKDAITGGVLSVMVEGTSTQGTFNLDTGALSVTSSVEGIIMKNISHTLSQAEQDAGKRRFEAVLIPVVHSEILLDALKLEFTLDSDTYTWAADSVADEDKHLIHFDKSKQHVYNMTLNTSDEEVAVAELKIEIGDWDESDGGNWAAVKPYSVFFSGNSSTRGSAPEQMFGLKGTQITLPGSGDLEKDTHYVYGWNTQPDGNGTQYVAGDTFVIPDHDVTLYARWLVKIKSVSAGWGFTLILKEDGSLWATGNNISGQLGVGDTNNRSTPVQVWDSTNGDVKMTNVEEVFTKCYYTIIQKKDGSLWAMGNNHYGELGIGENRNTKTIPVQIPTMNDDLIGNPVVSVAVGAFHTMFLKKDETLWATGWNDNGKLGLNDTIDRSTPVPVTLMNTEPSNPVTDVFTGNHYTVMKKKDGTLWATGYNLYGQLGVEDTNNRLSPVQIPTMNTNLDTNPVTTVSTGNAHTMFLKENGELWATGRNWYGQLGLGDSGVLSNRSRPEPVASMNTELDTNPVVAVFTGNHHTIIQKKDGTFWATGLNDYGQLGLGDTNNRKTPVRITSMGSDVVAVSGGENHTMFLKNDGTLWAVGNNDQGQLGIGTALTMTTTPVQVIL